MPDPSINPKPDSVLDDWLRKQKYYDPVQYSLQDQLRYLIAIANRFGLCDAADCIKTGMETNLLIVGKIKEKTTK